MSKHKPNDSSEAWDGSFCRCMLVPLAETAGQRWICGECGREHVVIRSQRWDGFRRKFVDDFNYDGIHWESLGEPLKPKPTDKSIPT
jgi:hypothetical protein